MFANYFIINQEFIGLLSEQEKDIVSDFAYSCYKRLHRSKSSLLSKEKFLTSTRTKTAVTFLYCPKCKENGFLVTHMGHRTAHNLKFCGHCGEPSIDYKFTTGKQKIESLINLSSSLESQNSETARTLNQQIIALISSVYEVYLREFYADILNSKFVKNNLSLYEKFIRDSRNEFQNPGKAQYRMKNDLAIDYKATIGNEYFKVLTLLSEYRNVIVHNNGICDYTFVKIHPEIKLGATLAPSLKTITLFLLVTESCVKLLDNVYQAELREWVLQNIYNKTKDSAMFMTRKARKNKSSTDASENE